MQRKLILPHLEASFTAEVEKFQKFQKLIDAVGEQLDSTGTGNTGILARPIREDNSCFLTNSQMAEMSCSPQLDVDELTDLPLDQFLAKEQQMVFSVGWQQTDDKTSDGRLGSFPLQESPTKVTTVFSSHHPVDAYAPLIPPPTVVGHHFYDHADEDEIHSHTPGVVMDTGKLLSSASSTATGGSGSPTSEEERSKGIILSGNASNFSTSSLTGRHHSNSETSSHQLKTTTDDFLEDDYLHQYRRNLNIPSQGEYDDENEEDADQELSGLLSRGSLRSASYLDGWHLTVDKQRRDDDLEV